MVDLDLKHLSQLNDLKEDFPLPDLNSHLYFARKGIIQNGKIVAAGFVKLTTESILIIDKSLPRITRAKLLLTLIEQLKRELDAIGIDETHVFLQGDESEKTEEFLKKLAFIPLEERCMYLPKRKVQHV